MPASVISAAPRQATNRLCGIPLYPAALSPSLSLLRVPRDSGTSPESAPEQPRGGIPARDAAIPCGVSIPAGWRLAARSRVRPSSRRCARRRRVAVPDMADVEPSVARVGHARDARASLPRRADAVCVPVPRGRRRLPRASRATLRGNNCSYSRTHQYGRICGASVGHHVDDRCQHGLYWWA